MTPREADEDWKHAIAQHDEKLPSLEEEAREPCFDRSRFADRIAMGDDWQKLIQGHLYLEFIATRMLEAELPNPQEISLSRMGFSARMDLIAALNIVPPEYVPKVRKVSKLRNLVAHELRLRTH